MVKTNSIPINPFSFLTTSYINDLTRFNFRDNTCITLQEDYKMKWKQRQDKF